MLEEYGKKRDFSKTPEPSGSTESYDGPLRFVVQKHSARRLHYDFRLELDGVLVSWAVPKGPSYDPAEKRLAVQTEDHPLDYRNFEGIIPEGEYGGGPVIIWDSGVYAPDSEGEVDWKDTKKAQQKIREGLKKGKLSFTLRGQKLHGSWTLVRLKNTPKDWLMMKHKDEFADPSKDIVAEEDTSVRSGRTIEELEEGLPAANPLLVVKELPGARRSKFPQEYTPMLATLADEAFAAPGWIYEPKMDGIRAVALINKGDIELLSRRGLDLTRSYPEIVEQLEIYSDRTLVLDGEIVALDEQGRPSFQMLQQRSGLTGAADVKNARAHQPIFYYIFDIMYIDGYNLEGVTLENRRKVLEHTLVPQESVRLLDRFDTDGDTAYKASVAIGLEGIVAKKKDSLYEPGRRARSWLKVKSTQSSEFLICGYTEGTGSRNQTFGSLIVGYYSEQGKLSYAGGVGTGFNEKTLKMLQERFKPLHTDKCPFDKKPPGKRIHWLKPELIAEIKFAEWTRDGILRAPVFLRLREDIKPKEARRTPIVSAHKVEIESMEEAKAMQSGDPNNVVNLSSQRLDKTRQAIAQKAQAAIEQLREHKDKLLVEVEGNTISFTNLNKIFWPETDHSPAVTKRDYAMYLAKVAPYLLHHTKDRPITLVRFPNGIKGGKFYQKHWEAGLPDFVETVWLYGEQAGKDQEYLLCNNVSTLLWLAQIADLELHTWQSRVSNEGDGRQLTQTFTGSVEQLERSALNYPDFLLFDLDPYIYSGQEKKGDEPELNKIAFEKTCDLAMWLKELLQPLNIEPFIKTTGKTGLHLYIPMKRDYDFDHVRAFSEVIGRFVMQQHPNDVTMDWAVVKRTGKIFLDHNMNARGKTLASIYSPRVAREASVSMPISWDELYKVYPTDFTIHNVEQRLNQVGDLWENILEHKADIGGIVSQHVPPIKKLRRRTS